MNPVGRRWNGRFINHADRSLKGRHEQCDWVTPLGVRCRNPLGHHPGNDRAQALVAQTMEQYLDLILFGPRLDK